MSSSSSLEMGVFRRLCVNVDTPRSLACFLLSKYGEWEQLVSLPPPYRDVDFKLNYLVSKVLSKSVLLPLKVDRTRVALEKFRSSEELCKETNHRFDSIRASNSSPEFLRRMRYWAHRILGNLSKEKLGFIEQNFRFGPGATSSCVGVGVLPSRKYACDVHTTPRLRPLTYALMGYSWYTSPHGGVFVTEGSKVTTVPKDAKTERVICIEPHLNIFFQLGVGAGIRRQLKRFGVDLNTQEWNQFLASRAEEWRLATIDLASASDTISLNVVKTILPRKWFDLLYLGRCDFSTMPDGSTIQLEKFSSMGNGYTFELETLIFLCAALSVGADRKLLAVYGDDIVVEKRVADELIEALDFLGFKVNREKTFLEGNFYESCGTDWYEGCDVRPFFLKGDYHDPEEASLLIANKIRRYSGIQLTSSYWVCDSRFLPAWLYVVSRASSKVRATCIPEGVGDEGLLRAFDEATPRIAGAHLGWNPSYVGRVLPNIPVKAKSRTSLYGAYLLSLHKGSAFDISRADEFLRGRVRRSGKLRDVHCWHWTGVGPWV